MDGHKYLPFGSFPQKSCGEYFSSVRHILRYLFMFFNCLGTKKAKNVKDFLKCHFPFSPPHDGKPSTSLPAAKQLTQDQERKRKKRTQGALKSKKENYKKTSLGGLRPFFDLGGNLGQSGNDRRAGGILVTGAPSRPGPGPSTICEGRSISSGSRAHHLGCAISSELDPSTHTWAWGGKGTVTPS